MLEVDDMGLDDVDRRLLEAIALKFDGGPGLTPLLLPPARKVQPLRMSASHTFFRLISCAHPGRVITPLGYNI